MASLLSTSNLAKLRQIFEKSGKSQTVSDVLLTIQEHFASLESSYEEYLEDESNEDSQFKIQEAIADMAIASQEILLILEYENQDWAPSPSLENAISMRLTSTSKEK